MVGICGTSAGTVKLCPAAAAFGARIYIAAFKFILNSFVVNAVPYVTEPEFFITHKLVAGI